MADSWWVVKSSQESVYSSGLSSLSERGGASLLCSPLSLQGEAKFDICARRSIGGGGEGSIAGAEASETGSGSRRSVCKSYQGSTPFEAGWGLVRAFTLLLESRFQSISKPLRKNLAVLGVAFIHALSSGRSGYGNLSLASLARMLPTHGTPHAREKRLHRFLKNHRLDFRAVASSLGDILLSHRKGFCPVLFDQTKSGSAQALIAAVPYAGRSLPIGCYTFSYPLDEPNLDSQNQLEHIFLLDIEESLPKDVIPVWIGDRAYARSLLLLQSEKEGRPYIIRGREGTIIEYKGSRMKLRQLKAKPYVPLRYENVCYHSSRKVAVDVIVYNDPKYKEIWYLLTPVSYRDLLTTDIVVELYRERMQIEQSFRDFKTHLGMRGLQLKVDIAERIGRLILAFCLIYILCVLLGESPIGQQARKVFEIPRKIPRHGTTRTLSALMIAMLMLSHPAWKQVSISFIINTVINAAKGKSSLLGINALPP